MTHWIALALVALTLVGACTRTSLPPIVQPKRVFVIVMENHSYEEALQGSYTVELEKQAGVATNYHAITHPSVPNYLAITSGDTWGIDADIYRALPPQDIGHQLTSAHIRWRAYMEGLGPGGCFDSTRPYVSDHNPFAYYGGRCPGNVVPFSELSQDMNSTATRFSWIGPDICHDQHDCSIAVGDDWLRQTVGTITSSPAWQADAVLFITWDEDSGRSDNRVLTLVLRPDVKHRVSAVSYDHYSLLATIEDILGVPRLANAARATPMRDLAG
ncbi:MAG TPA: alkaline phosphatase family protein [Candidatus Polarisedimenticolia bacterium]|nr:alkaline phosphatase family protein [Candidatus Polarisedimenticolia bacterium]